MLPGNFVLGSAARFLYSTHSLPGIVVIMDGTHIGRRAVVRDAVLDKNVLIGEGVEVGVNKDDDRARGLVVSDGGITVVGKGQEISK